MSRWHCGWSCRRYAYRAEDDQAQTRWCSGFIPVENGDMYEEMDDVVRGVGQVCIAASSLEWSLAYCTSVLRCKGDDWFVDVFASPGQPLKQFRKLTSDAYGDKFDPDYQAQFIAKVSFEGLNLSHLYQNKDH